MFDKQLSFSSSEILHLTIVVYLKKLFLEADSPYLFTVQFVCFSHFMKKLIYAKARETRRSQWVKVSFKLYFPVVSKNAIQIFKFQAKAVKYQKTAYTLKTHV